MGQLGQKVDLISSENIMDYSTIFRNLEQYAGPKSIRNIHTIQKTNKSISSFERRLSTQPPTTLPPHTPPSSPSLPSPSLSMSLSLSLSLHSPSVSLSLSQHPMMTVLIFTSCRLMRSQRNHVPFVSFGRSLPTQPYHKKGQQ